MPTITYVDASGERFDVQATTGDSVMSTALDAGIEGVLAECGGGCACATCHCYVDENWLSTVGEPDGIEESMLAHTTSPRKRSSRLSCQITVTDELDGLIVNLPKSQ